MSKGLVKEVRPEAMVQIPIRLDAEQYARLRQAAFDRNESMTAIVRRALDRHFNDTLRENP